MSLSSLRRRTKEKGQRVKDAIRGVLDNLELLGSPSAPRWMLPLPADLIYLIIDKYLDRDWGTVKNLSLTNRSLTPYCRKLLLRRIAVITVKHENSNTPFERFAVLLKGGPHFSELVEELRIVDRHFCVLPGPEPISKPQIAIRTILTYDWRSLRRLHLGLQAEWNLMSTEMRSSIQRVLALPTLRELVLSALQIPVSWLSECTHLEVLELRNGCKAVQSITPISTGFVAPQSLLVHHTTPSELATLLSPTSPLKPDALNHLSFAAPRGTVDDIFRSLPLTVIRSIRSLETILIQQTDSNDPPAPSLEAFANLTSISIGEDITTPNPSSLDWAIQMLSSLPPTARLRTIKLSFRYDDPKHIMAADWAKLNQLIERRWRRLERLNVTGYARYPLEMDWYRLDYLKRRLPAVLPSLRAGVLATEVRNVYDLWN
ncbi:hypothetical protein DFP72DRAFT_901570 [Ephemerocybe angulata]|uniref:Uncharacterized protein n=1 Tax=Ephemerocybe angulata TaxID=980116 RepID=A0A8H6HUE6_9AGAR|nr:hypothetical protein DFP72DRAFT_901570 [Tulosesus angulatus]